MNAAYYLLRSGNVFSIAGPAFLLHLQPLLLLPLHHYAAALRGRVVGCKRAPILIHYKDPALLACLAGLFLYLCLFSLEAKEICCVLAWVGREREVCFQWLFITILIQTRLINQFTTFFFIQCTLAIVKIC